MADYNLDCGFFPGAYFVRGLPGEMAASTGLAVPVFCVVMWLRHFVMFTSSFSDLQPLLMHLSALLFLFLNFHYSRRLFFALSRFSVAF